MRKWSLMSLREGCIGPQTLPPRERKGTAEHQGCLQAIKRPGWDICVILTVRKNEAQKVSDLPKATQLWDRLAQVSPSLGI